MEIVSRIGKIQTSSERVFSLISNFDNLQDVPLPNGVNNFTHDTDTCSFDIDKIGLVTMKIVEREANSLVKIEGGEGSPIKFKLWIQLKELSNVDTRVRVTLRAKINIMLQPMVKKPLNNFVEMLVTRLEGIR